MWLLLEALEYQGVARWRWRLTGPGGGFLADHRVKLDRASAEYEGFVNLGAFVRHHTDPDNQVGSELAAVRRVGEWLGREVLGLVGPAMVEEGPVTVRVRLPAGAEELLYRPLELGHVNGRPLALQDVSLVLEPGGGEAPAKRPVGERLRMLAVFSLPTGYSPLGLRAERRALSELAREITGRYGKAMELRVLQYGATRARLRDVLEEGEGWDVVHFSGHGLPGGLVLERADGSQDVIATRELVPLLRPSRRQLKLVTLSSCSSAAATAAQTLRLLGIEPPRATAAEVDDSRPLPALAAQLVSELGCAVLAMRYPVLDEFAVALGRELYDRLLRQRQPLARALQLALQRAVGEEPEPGRSAISVATPALFGALAAELELELPDAGAVVFERSRLAGVPPEPERLVGRTGPLARASAALAPSSGRSGVLFQGMAGGGKTTCALELVHRHQENFPVVVWYKAPDEGLEGDVEIRGELGVLAMELETKLPGLKVAHLVERAEELKAFLPQLHQFFAEHAVLVVVDNLESLLSERGDWRDDRWGLVLGALTEQRGLSRLVLTSRRRPAELDEGMLVESIHALSLEESVLLARELPNLGALLRGQAPGVEAKRGRELVVRTLEVVQGHPKLIELADGAARESGALETRLAEAGQALDRRRLRAFFATGDTEVGEEEQLWVLEGWARGAAQGLDEGSRTLFWFLCCLEEPDRERQVLEANWRDLWNRLGNEGEPPDLEVALATPVEQALVELEAEAWEGYDSTYHRVHPTVAEVGRGQAEADFQEAVDAELVAYWRSVYEHGLEREAEGLGPLVVLAGQRAMPYLVRLQNWQLLSHMLEQVMIRDQSPTVAAAVMPALRLASTASEGAASSQLVAAGLLARCLRVLRSDETEALLRQVIDRAIRQGRHHIASAMMGDLADVLRTSGRLREALTEVERMANLEASAVRGPWSLLADQVRRLQVLADMGENEQVLVELGTLRKRMAVLPEQRDENDSTDPWLVREALLHAGSTSARHLKRWDEALGFVAEMQESQRRRQAPLLEQANTAFEANSPLLELGRLREARDLLDRCREVFELEHHVGLLGKVFGALADFEARLGHYHDARQYAERSLRYSYLLGDPDDISLGHHNLASYFEEAGERPELALAHLIAALLIAFQTDSGRLPSWLGTAAILLTKGGHDWQPVSFDELCQRVEDVPGTRFSDLVQRLPHRVSSDDSALAQVLKLAAEVPDDEIGRQLAGWQPAIAATVAAVQGDQNAAENLRPILAHLTVSPYWAALAVAIERVLDGEGDRTALVRDLDPIDAGIIDQILQLL
jgi:tetratricopeptide (TPR) repeat protein